MTERNRCEENQGGLERRPTSGPRQVWFYSARSPACPE